MAFGIETKSLFPKPHLRKPTKQSFTLFFLICQLNRNDFEKLEGNIHSCIIIQKGAQHPGASALDLIPVCFRSLCIVATNNVDIN